MNSSLEKIVSESLIEKSKSDYIIDKFSEFSLVAEEWNSKAMAIVVTDESQIEIINQAKEGKKILKSKRIEIEKTRKKLKEQSLQEGRLIDGVAKYLMSIIEPAEKHLELQESFVLIMEKKRKEELKDCRIKLLAPYGDVLNSDFLQLDIITEEAFDGLLKNAKIMQQTKIENERIELERQNAAEQAKKEEADRLALQREQERIELIRVKEELRIEREKKEKEDAILAKKREEERIELIRVKDELRIEREKKEKEDAIRIQKETDVKAELESVKIKLEIASEEIKKTKENASESSNLIEEIYEAPVFKVFNSDSNADKEIDVMVKKNQTIEEGKFIIRCLIQEINAFGNILPASLNDRINLHLKKE